MKRRIAVLLALLGLVAIVLGVLTPVGAAQGGDPGPPVFVTICHAAGLEGTTHYVTLTLPENAVYGVAGHFNENGTPQAGHEQDYLGACIVTTTTTEATTSTIPVTTTSVAAPTTTVPSEETTIPEVTTTTTPPTTVPETSSSTVPEVTSTTAPTIQTTTTVESPTSSVPTPTTTLRSSTSLPSLSTTDTAGPITPVAVNTPQSPSELAFTGSYSWLWKFGLVLVLLGLLAALLDWRIRRAREL